MITLFVDNDETGALYLEVTENSVCVVFEPDEEDSIPDKFWLKYDDMDEVARLWSIYRKRHLELAAYNSDDLVDVVKIYKGKEAAWIIEEGWQAMQDYVLQCMADESDKLRRKDARAVD